MISGKKFVIIMFLIMIATTIIQYLLKEFQVFEQIQELLNQVIKGFSSLKSFKM